MPSRRIAIAVKAVKIVCIGGNRTSENGAWPRSTAHSAMAQFRTGRKCACASRTLCINILRIQPGTLRTKAAWQSLIELSGAASE
jgi:hypothetical protein